MLAVLHKEYTTDVIDYKKQEALCEYRATTRGQVSYCIGKAVAVYYIVRVLLAAKQIIRPVYLQQDVH